MTYIRITFPGSKKDFHTEKDLKRFNLVGVKLDIMSSTVGPETIASRYEETLAIPGTLQQIVHANVQSNFTI